MTKNCGQRRGNVRRGARPGDSVTMISSPANSSATCLPSRTSRRSRGGNWRGSGKPKWQPRRLGNLLRFDEHAGYVVVLRRGADEEIKFRHQPLEHLAGLERFSDFNRGQQAHLAILFLTRVLGFDQSVREDNQPVAGGKRDGCRLIFHFWLNAEGQAAHIEALNLSAGPPKDGIVVSRVDVVECAPDRI